MGHSSQPQGSSSFCPWVLYPCFNKPPFCTKDTSRILSWLSALNSTPLNLMYIPQPHHMVPECETLGFGAKLVSTFPSLPLLSFRGSSRSMVLLEHSHVHRSGYNPLAFGYSIGRRKPAFLPEVSTLAGMVRRPRNLMPPLYCCPYTKSSVLGMGQPPK